MSSADAVAVFSEHAREYTALRRRLIPGFDAFYGAVVDVLGLLADPPGRVLDLGAGTGLLSALVAGAFPEARIELLDGSAEMLCEARETLGTRVSAIHVSDMAETLPVGPFDAVVSALAIHHLEDPAKRELFARVHEALRPGGVFVNAEQVSAPTAELTDEYVRVWRRGCEALGATADEIGAARHRMRHDHWAETETQLRWLRETGFTADCVYKSWWFSVMAGFRPEEPR